MSPVPGLSVVVVRFAGGECIRRVLDALLAQPECAEILVAYGPHHSPSEQLRSDYEGVVWLGCPDEDPAKARAIGVRAAQGNIVACTEDHCTPQVGWARAVLRAHGQSPAVAIGGPIAKREPDSPAAWAAYLMEYGRYAPPLPDGRAPSCSDCNVSYKREALREIQPVWCEAFRETSVHRALEDRGGWFEWVSEMLVTQSREIDAHAFAAERYTHGRVYGAQRIQGIGTLARLRLLAQAPAIPVLFYLRARRLAQRMPAMPRGTMGILWRASVAWAHGELMGTLTGTAPESSR